MIYAKINNEVSSVSYDYKTDDVQDILQLVIRFYHLQDNLYSSFF